MSTPHCQLIKRRVPGTYCGKCRAPYQKSLMIDIDLLHSGTEHLYKAGRKIEDHVFDDLKVFRLIEACAASSRLSYRSSSDMADELGLTYKILASPCAVAGDIAYRQGIFRALLAADGLPSRLCAALSGARVLRAARERYDDLDNNGRESDFIRAFNRLWFLNNYKILITGLCAALDGAPPGGGLDPLREIAFRELAYIASDEFSGPIAEFTALFSGLRALSGELELRSGSFAELAFAFDKDEVASSVPDAPILYETLAKAERALGLWREEEPRLPDKMEVKTLRPHNSLEKRLIVKLSGDPSVIPEGRERFAPICARLCALHDSIDVEPLARAYDQSRFYRCICNAVKYLEAHSSHKFAFAEVAEENVLELRGLFDPVVVLQKATSSDEGSAKSSPAPGEIVENDLSFGNKSIFVITGPNNGGKTSFARGAGISLLLYASGCPIPASGGKIGLGVLPDTHFTAEETHKNESGRLAHEMRRLEAALAAANERTLLILNELFAGTGSPRALELFGELAAKIEKIGCRALYITHFHNIAAALEERQEAGDASWERLDNLIADITPDGRRTYKILPARPSDSSFSADIVKKYRLDWDSLEKLVE